MSRIIINIEEGIDQQDAMQYVWEAMKEGRCSDNGRSYCFCSKFRDGTVVIANKRKADIFTVIRSDEE